MLIVYRVEMQGRNASLRLEVHAISTRIRILGEFEIIGRKPKWFKDPVTQLEYWLA